jgi:hypothetical protein
LRSPSFAILESASLVPAQNLSESEIHGNAEARIRRYRTGEVNLRLAGADGRPLRKDLRVRIEQTRHSFLFGANVFMLGHCKSAADNSAYEKAFSGLLNYATVPFYWWDYEPRQGSPGYADTERIAAWCAAHHIVVKGHPLAWNEGQPSWLPTDLAEVTRLQMQRIADIFGRFRGGIGIWDVVNEATDFDRASTREGGPTLTAAIRQAGVHTSWWILRQQLSTHQVVTVVLPTADGRVLKIRRGTTPEPIHREIYSTLRIPTEVMKPVRSWHEVSNIVTE